jgi:hypothetical protein
MVFDLHSLADLEIGKTGHFPSSHDDRLIGSFVSQIAIVPVASDVLPASSTAVIFPAVTNSTTARPAVARIANAIDRVAATKILRISGVSPYHE